MENGQRVLYNGCSGKIIEYLEGDLYLVNFGEAGNFRLHSYEFFIVQ